MTGRPLIAFSLLAIAAAATPGEATTSIGTVVLGACGNAPSVVAQDVDASSFTPDDPEPGTASCAKLCAKWVAFCRGAVAAKLGCYNRVRTKYAALKLAECAAIADPGAEEACRSNVKA